MASITQKITPCLWFDRQAEEAARYYTTIFKNSKVGDIVYATKTGFEEHGLPEGTVMTVDFVIAGLKFVAINGGPIFKFNPSISFLVTCDSADEVDMLWEKLSTGVKPLMELGSYPFSERYGWTQDKYGLSWQVMLMKDKPAGQKIIPTLMFVGEQAGKAETAVQFWQKVFRNSSFDYVMRYGKGEEPDKEGTIKHAGFVLDGQEFAAMDSAHAHEFAFNEAISLMVECQTQPEIDYYWEKLTDGGQESFCGWLKDRFGVSWQVAPMLLQDMLLDPDRQKVERVMSEFLKMRKIDIAALKKAFEG